MAAKVNAGDQQQVVVVQLPSVRLGAVRVSGMTNSRNAGSDSRRRAAGGRARPGYTDHGLVSARADGSPCWPGTVRANFKRICQRAGLGDEWHPHERRHSFVSILSDAGVDIDQIADAAWHINAAVTRSVYRHVLADKLATAARVMDATFRSAGGAS